MLDEVLDPLAKSRPQLDQLPTELRKAAEQMWWRAEASRGSPPEPGEVEIGPSPRQLESRSRFRRRGARLPVFGRASPARFSVNLTRNKGEWHCDPASRIPNVRRTWNLGFVWQGQQVLHAILSARTQ